VLAGVVVPKVLRDALKLQGVSVPDIRG